MLVGLYGGTFDPVHIGHTHAALSVCVRLGFKEVRMVLSARPGHREAPASHAEHRWNMLRLACDQDDRLVPDDIELVRSGASYTITTIETLQQRDAALVPCWIMGQDAFATLPIWHRWQDLLDVCNLIVTDRPGDCRKEPAAVRELCARAEVADLDPERVGQIHRVKGQMLDISASAVRAALAQGEPVEHLLDREVYAYIKRHQLYQCVP